MCQGTREVITTEQVWSVLLDKYEDKLTQGVYTWISYSDMCGIVENISRGLHRLGCTNSNLAIYAETKAEWMQCFLACMLNTIPVVTVYTTLGSKALLYALDQTEVTHIIVDALLLDTLKGIIESLENLRCVIYIGQASNHVISGFDNIHVVSLENVIELGQKHVEDTFSLPSPSDTAIIMYTSGSTGNPKGVVLSHKSVLGVVGGMKETLTTLYPTDVYIGYLPLAHILEMAAEMVTFCSGACVGYSNPMTLSDSSPRVKAGTKGDIVVLRPTIMACVPIIMDRIRKGVMAKIKGSSCLKQKMFNLAYRKKYQKLSMGQNTPILNLLVFKKFSKALGGRIRCMISGGAPLAEETQRFMNICFSVPILQGYGLTETCSGGTICNIEDPAVGTVGVPLTSCLIKLIDWDEGGYRVSDRDRPDIKLPRGEVLISGINVSDGYYKDPEKTAECFLPDKDGRIWFHTGDIGQIHPNGTLRIIDRKKDLVKLQQGEYVSLGKVEAICKGSEFVENVMVHASPLQTYCIALVTPNVLPIQKLAEKCNIDSDSLEDMCSNPSIIANVLASVQSVCKGEKLARFEIPQKLAISSIPWTPESELVTAALKLKRQNVQKEFQSVLDKLYAN